MKIFNNTDTDIFTIANALQVKDNLIFSWTDDLGTQFDILLTKYPPSLSEGYYQGGIKSYSLFVSIMRIGSWGFKRDQLNLHPNYVAEKLCLQRDCITTVKVTELINSILKHLQEN